MNAPKNNPTNNDNQSGSNSARFEQQILNTSSFGVLITRIGDGTILYANKAISNLLGATDIDSIIGRPVPDFYWDPKDRQMLLDRFRAEGSITGNETRARRFDGRMVWVSISIQPFDFDGEQVLLSEIIDITERKQAENELQESQRLLQLVMDNIPQAVFWKDKELVFMGGNQAVAEDAGLDSPQYLVGKTDFDMPWKDRAELYHADDRQVLELGEAKLNYEEMQTSPTGKQTWLRTSKIPMRDIDGNIFAVLGMYEDITERKQAEEAVQTNRARFQGLVETLSDWIWEVDQNGNYTYISPRIKDLLGYQPEEVLGKTPFDLMPPEEAQRVAGVFGPLLSTQQPLVALENTNRHKDGRLVVFETSGVPFFSINGEFKGYRGTDRDITERKHLEHEIQESFERRGYQVQVSTEISQNIAAASKLSDLFDRVVTLTKERLGYYHTQLLRYDATQDAVVLINGYGETGAKMLAGGHKMPMGMGLIGTAAASGNIVMRPTLADDPDWQPNPLLPETKGEIAVPIKLGEQILGVLDVQSSQAGALTEDDRLLLEGLCGQIAIAIRSAELVETIRQNEARLAEALRTARLANWEYDVEKDIFTFNDQFYSIFHTTAEKAGGYQLSSARYAELFVHPDDMEVVGTEIGKALSSTERVYNTTIDHRIRYEDGGIGYITVKLTVERDENGKITRYYGANQDITERKQAEARLAEALKIARLANWEYDVEKDIFTFNDQFYSIFHTTVEKVGGYQITSAQYAELFVYPDDAPLVGAEIGKALSSTERVYNTSLDHRILYADGSIGYITVAVTVERDENGKITRFYGANQDITERKQAEEALASERRLLRVLMSTMLDLVYVKDAEHRFLLASDTVVRSLGAETSDEVVGKTDFDFHPRELAEQYFADEKSLMESGLPLIDHEESAMDHATGTFRWLSSTKAPLRDSQGNVIGLVGLNRDITERKQAEDALRRNEQEMAERLEEINRLYRAMSHEGWKTYRETADLPTGFMFDQTGAKPLEDNILDNENFTSIPMKVLGGETVGNLAVANDLRLPMSAEDLDFLQQVSDQVALALEGARLAAQTQSALAQTEKLSEAGLLFTRATDLQEVVRIAVETLGISKINRAALETFNYNSENEVESMDVLANWWNGTGHKTTDVGTRYTPEILPLIQLFLTPTPVFIEDAFQDERVDGVSLQIVKKLNIHAVAILPLFLADKQIGVLLLESEEIHEFNQDEIRLFSAMGPQISTVLENRRQYERAQQQAERESTLNIISQKIQSATTVEAVLQIAARELGHALGAPMTIAQLSMKDRK